MSSGAPSRTTHGSTPTRLPSGRASRAAYSREDVARHQRERLLTAMVEVVAETGYVATTVSAVIRHAGVSRATFYQQFADKQECFFAAYDMAVHFLLSRVGEVTAVDDSGVPSDGSLSFPVLLHAYLDALVERESYARVFLLEAYAVGAPAVVRRAQGQQLFVRLLIGLFGATTEADRFVCETLVAAIGSMLTARLAERDLEAIPALHGPLVALAEQLFAR